MNSTFIARAYRKVARPIFSFLEIDAVTGYRVTRRADMLRFGSNYGGWSIPSLLLSENSICYCAGCGEDITFDLALIETFGCRVYAFDPTPRAIVHAAKEAGHIPNYAFADIGLWNEDTTLKFFEPKDPTHVSHSAVNLQKTATFFEAKVKRLSNVMAANNHDRLTLLKLDIEGAEYVVLESILDDKTPIDILCVEYDEFFQPLDGDYKTRIRESIDTLLSVGFTMVCAEGNGNYTFVHNSAAC